MIPVYSNLKRVAKQKGMTLCKIEKDAGLSTGSLNKWDKVSPSVNSLKKVADILEVSVDSLLTETEG